MVCSNCGNQLSNTEKFCAKCGEKNKALTKEATLEVEQKIAGAASATFLGFYYIAAFVIYIMTIVIAGKMFGFFGFIAAAMLPLISTIYMFIVAISNQVYWYPTLVGIAVFCIIMCGVFGAFSGE